MSKSQKVQKATHEINKGQTAIQQVKQATGQNVYKKTKRRKVEKVNQFNKSQVFADVLGFREIVCFFGDFLGRV